MQNNIILVNEVILETSRMLKEKTYQTYEEYVSQVKLKSSGSLYTTFTPWYRHPHNRSIINNLRSGKTNLASIIFCSRCLRSRRLKASPQGS